MSFKKEILNFGAESKPEIGERKQLENLPFMGPEEGCEMQ
jgi:hypothetical protein